MKPSILLFLFVMTLTATFGNRPVLAQQGQTVPVIPRDFEISPDSEEWIQDQLLVLEQAKMALAEYEKKNQDILGGIRAAEEAYLRDPTEQRAIETLAAVANATKQIRQANEDVVESLRRMGTAARVLRERAVERRDAVKQDIENLTEERRLVQAAIEALDQNMVEFVERLEEKAVDMDIDLRSLSLTPAEYEEMAMLIASFDELASADRLIADDADFRDTELHVLQQTVEKFDWTETFGNVAINNIQTMDRHVSRLAQSSERRRQAYLALSETKHAQATLAGLRQNVEERFNATRDWISVGRGGIDLGQPLIERGSVSVTPPDARSLDRLVEIVKRRRAPDSNQD